MSGSATLTMVTSSSSMKMPVQTATRVHHFGSRATLAGASAEVWGVVMGAVRQVRGDRGRNDPDHDDTPPLPSPPWSGTCKHDWVRELLIARNPDPDSSLGFLLRLPLGEGLLFRTSGTWPRGKALYCHPVHLRVAGAAGGGRAGRRTLVRASGAAIDLVVGRGREHRSQIVYTTARGRQMVFWQSPKTRKQSKPRVTLPTARASGVPDLTIVVDAHERYPYRFSGQQVTTERGALRCGDYGLVVAGELVASVERKSVADLVSTITSGRMGFALGELASLPRAAVVVEERYSALIAQTWMRPAAAANAVAELQVRYPSIPIVFCDNRKLAQEWTFRFLGAVSAWWRTEQVVGRGLHEVPDQEGPEVSPAAEPSTAQVRAWARDHGLEVSDRGRLRPEVRRGLARRPPGPVTAPPPLPPPSRGPGASPQLGVLGLEVEDHADPREVEPGGEQLADPPSRVEVVRAVAARASRRPVGLEQPTGLVETQVLHPRADQLGRDGDAVDALGPRPVPAASRSLLLLLDTLLICLGAIKNLSQRL